MTTDSTLPDVTLASFGNLIPMDAITSEELGAEAEEEESEKEKEREAAKEKEKEDIEMNASGSVDPSTSATASTSTSTPTFTKPIEVLPAEIITITSTSPSGLKTRSFPAKYYKPISDSQAQIQQTQNRQFIDLPESYFSPTPSELQLAFAGQVRKRELLVDAPLLTKALRDKETASKEKVKANRWPQTRIRIKFSDRSHLESVFPSTDGLNAIYEFVKCSLAEEHRQTSFILYQTPPKTDYVKGDPKLKGKSLIDLQFTPSSVFYIKFLNEDLNLSATLPPLIPALLNAAAEFPIPPSFDPTANSSESEGNKKSQAGGSTEGRKLGFGGASGKVTPTWMRGGKSGKK